MAEKKIEPAENFRKRKRLVPTRESGTPAIDVVDELFAEAFSKREQPRKERNSESVEVVPTTTNPYQPLPINNSSEIFPTSPEKNFTKVPNSLASQAIPQGLFKGLSKHTYDVLYKLTRGAVKPVRAIQLTRFELMKRTGLSENTQRAHIKYLTVAGLLTVSYETGKHEGATYEVLIPEEINEQNYSKPLPTPTNPYQPLPTSTEDYQELVPVTTQKLGVVSTTFDQQNIGQNRYSNTSFKTYTIDDEGNFAFSRFIRRFEDASKKLTGKGLSKREVEKWEALAELLILELEIAASRANGVSSVPAFLTEVLRRQFFTARRDYRNSSAKPSPKKPDTVGKSDSEIFEIKALDESGREAALEQLREFSSESFLEDFAKWYTPEDWQWLTEQLKNATEKEGIESDNQG